LVEKVVRVQLEVANIKDDPSRAGSLVAELEAIRGKLEDKDAFKHAESLTKRVRRDLEHANAMERHAQRITQVNQVLDEARRALEAGDCSKLDALRAAFKAAVAALGEAKDMVDTQVQEAERIWAQMAFRKQAQPLLDQAVAAASLGEQARGPITAAADALDRFLEAVREPPTARDRPLHKRLRSAALNLRKPGADVSRQVLLVVYVTAEFLELQDKIRPVLRELLREHLDRFIGRRAVLITKDGDPSCWDATEDVPRPTTPPFGDNVRLADAFRSGSDAVEDVVIRQKSVPFRTVFIWTTRNRPKDYPPSSMASPLSNKQRGVFSLYWFGQNVPVDRSLEEMFGRDDYVGFEPDDAKDMRGKFKSLLGEIP
jgi:hypothetical protein